MRRALILTLGCYRAEEIPPGERERLTNKLVELYRDDPDAGIHGAAEWTLRKWNQPKTLEAADVDLKKREDWGERRWHVNRLGQTLAVIDGPVEFLMGAPNHDRERIGEDQPPRRMAIPRRYSISTKEVTVEQFEQFLKTHTEFKPEGSGQDSIRPYSPDPDGPCIVVEWYAAAAFCNWLSEREGLPQNQWCYQPNKDKAYKEGMTIPADVLDRKGYRLPTEAEWEYACRAGSVTSRYYGVSLELLEKYEWYRTNSHDRAWSCGSLMPNDLGLFDMLGNVYEWSQDANMARRPEKSGGSIDKILESEEVKTDVYRVLRGGAFGVGPSDARAARRSVDLPMNATIYYGFRLARTLP